MIEGISFYDLRKKGFSGASDYLTWKTFFTTFYNKTGLKLQQCRSWEFTSGKGLTPKGDIAVWKKQELLWKKKLFADLGIKWQLCFVSYQDYEVLTKYNLTPVCEYVAKEVKPEFYEICNEPEGMFKVGSLWWKKDRTSEVTEAHFKYAKVIKEANPEAELVLSPYYHSNLKTEDGMYLQFRYFFFNAYTKGRHIYSKDSRLVTQPEWIKQVDECDWGNRELIKALNPKLDAILYWFDKNHPVAGIKFEDY